MNGMENRPTAGLVSRARKGDTRAFSKLVRLKMSSIVALTYRMTRDRQAAEDLAQDCFVTAWQKLRSLEKDASFEPWLMRIASNLTLNFLKKRSLQAETSLDELDSPMPIELSQRHSPEDDLNRKELREDVLDFMATLPDAQRLVFDLRFYQQLSFDEIAAITDRAVGTVKTNYRQAILKLRQTATGRGWVL